MPGAKRLSEVQDLIFQTFGQKNLFKCMGERNTFFREYVMFTMPLLKSLHALSCWLPKSNFTASRSGAGGAHPHQPPHFLLNIIPFYDLNCSWNC